MTKSNLILRMGETDEEVVEAMHDLKEAGTVLLTITQYMDHPSGTTPSPAGFVRRRS